MSEDRLSTLHLGNLGRWEGGGLERYFLELLERLSRRGDHVLGMALGREGPEGHLWGFAHPDEPLWKRFYKMRRAFDQARRIFPIEGVVAHFPLYAFPILDRLNVPFLVHFHGPWSEESRFEGKAAVSLKLKHYIERQVYRRAERFIVLSQAFGELLQRLYDVPGERIAVIPGGMDVGRFDDLPSKAQSRERLGWPQDRPVLLAVRRLVPRMGLGNLIAAMDSVRRVCPDVWLAIAGRGPLAVSLARQVEEMGLEGHVYLTGYLPEADLALAYRAADISIVPSSALEGFGLVAAESLAAGTPALVTPVGGLPEVVEGLSSDLVFEGADVEALAGGIADCLAGHRPLPDPLSCRNHARSFDWAHVIPMIEEVYGSVIR